MLNNFTKRLQMVSRQQRIVALALLAVAGAAAYGFTQIGGTKSGHSEVSSQSRKGLQRYTPSAGRMGQPHHSTRRGAGVFAPSM